VKRPLPFPDSSIHPVGNADANKVGPVQLNLLIHYGLLPTHTVLDVGCGIGRLAYKMADYLTSGSYYGFDISRAAVNWLNTNYASVLPNFFFRSIMIVIIRQERWMQQKYHSRTSSKCLTLFVRILYSHT
jgi:2-polyprenyl-3-methyl-5-hydroxy-6-metoxy-1,4-benzoquinol methylase